MKFLLTLLFLISLAFCDPEIGKAIPAEEVFTEIKKNILECISKEERASPELRNYALENLINGYKETLIFSQHRQNEIDRLVIRQCRRKAFLLSSKRASDKLRLVPEGEIKFKKDS